MKATKINRWVEIYHDEIEGLWAVGIADSMGGDHFIIAHEAENAAIKSARRIAKVSGISQILLRNENGEEKMV